MNLWSYLLTGSKEQTLPKAWLADTARLASYEAYTKRQRDQGAVISTPAQMAHAEQVAQRQRAEYWRQFDARLEAIARQAQPSKVREFARGKAR